MQIIDSLTTRDALAWSLGLAGVLWGVTVILAGALGRALYGKVSEMADDLKVIAKGHAALEATVSSHAARLERTEDAQIRFEEWRAEHRTA